MKTPAQRKPSDIHVAHSARYRNPHAAMSELDRYLTDCAIAEWLRGVSGGVR